MAAAPHDDETSTGAWHIWSDDEEEVDPTATPPEVVEAASRGSAPDDLASHIEHARDHGLLLGVAHAGSGDPVRAADPEPSAFPGVVIRVPPSPAPSAEAEAAAAQPAPVLPMARACSRPHGLPRRWRCWSWWLIEVDSDDDPLPALVRPPDDGNELPPVLGTLICLLEAGAYLFEHTWSSFVSACTPPCV